MSDVQNLNEASLKTLESSASIFSMIASSDAIGKSVIFLLVLASICSWAIILEKIYSFRSIKAKVKIFESLFWSGGVLEQIYESAKRTVDNPLAVIFVEAMEECRKKNDKSSEILRVSRKERIAQTMYLAKNRELDKMEKHLGFLAAVGSNALFVGLFGTVWGIIHSFQSIAVSKNATLAVVAPGIAEALFATAIGLMVAVPGVVFYHYLTSGVNEIESKIDDFSGELNIIFSRAIDEEKL